MHEYFAISVHFVVFYTNFNRKNRFYGIEIKNKRSMIFKRSLGGLSL
ncbi:unknown [Segatella copri CAG:164]|nr:unknown [Segatella copri CAG:164]